MNDGGGGRIRTFEGSAGRFTICSLWPLGNPTTGCCLLFGFRQKRCQWRQLLEIDGGGGRIRTFEGSAGRFTICSLWPLGNPTTGCCLLFGFRQKRCQWRQLLEIDGGGGRIRTFEGSAGRFTICSLWPLGNPTTGYCSLFGFRQKRCQWRQLLEIDGGGGRIRTFEGSAGRFTICSLWPLGNPTTGYCSLFGFRQKRCQWRQLLEIDGGGGRIRTFEGSAGRFTICSLWPLGNPTTSAGRIIANIPIL